MVRPAVLAIVLSLSGAPVAGVVCGLFCSQNASSTAHHSGCQDERSGGTGTWITGTHACDHSTALTAFVLQALSGRSSFQGVTAHVLPVVRFSSARFSEVTDSRPPPGSGGLTDRHFRIDILRI